MKERSAIASARIAGSVFLLFLLFLGVFSAAGNQGYTIVDLGTLGDSSYAFGINDRGQIAGWTELDEGIDVGFLWEQGQMMSLGTLGDFDSDSFAYGIDNRTQIVGSADLPSGQWVGFIWHNDLMEPLPLETSRAYAISDRQWIVGYNVSSHAFLWRQGTLLDLGTLGGQFSAAYDVNSAGQVVGESGTSGQGPAHAFLWQNGVMIDLGTLGGDESHARAINSRGQVVGESSTASGETHAFLWDDGIMIDLGTLGGTFSVANDINDRGQIVGRSLTGSDETRAFLWEGGGMIDLGVLPDTLTGFEPVSEARAINNRGEIVGYSGPVEFANHAVHWTR